MAFRKLIKAFIPNRLFSVIEPYGHLGEAVFLQSINSFPARGLKVIGVTGTNGKTTTSFFIHSMLEKAGYQVGLMSTIGYGVGTNITPQVHHMTNVSVPEMIGRLKEMKQQEMEWLVLETTSHALAQYRVWGIPYSIAVMTNVTHEHLDYHRTFKRYVNAKRKLFQMADRNRGGLRTGIINADDASAKLFASDISHPLMYGVKEGELRATQVELSPSGVRYKAQYKGETYDISCHIPGEFNVYNSLAAVGVGISLGLSKEQIERGIQALNHVEGRMTHIDEGQKFDVIVDFAHTPDSFEKLLKNFRPIVRGRLVALFGTPGRRDQSKGAIQGEIAGRYCDEVIVTEEDDRDVDGQTLMDSVAKGAEKAGKTREKDLFLVHDRTKAIEFALSRAQAGDTVLLLGKGHEKTIERADGEHPWNEIELTHKILKRFRT
jgi:UDP-N-acetylmuramoyl-L-alanyl-D-glutamate--2,6-diaminopimelate ligase